MTRQEYKEKTTITLLNLMIALSEIVNELLEATNGETIRNEDFITKLYSLSLKLQEASDASSVLLKEYTSTMDTDKELTYKDLEPLALNNEAVEVLNISVNIFLWILIKEIEKEGNQINIDEESMNLIKRLQSKGIEYNIETAVEYLFRGSKKIADLVDLLTK